MTFICNLAKAKSPWLLFNGEVYEADKKRSALRVAINNREFFFSKKDSLKNIELDSSLNLLAEQRPLRIQSSIDKSVSEELARTFYSYVRPQELKALKRVIDRKNSCLDSLLPGFDGLFSNGQRVFGLQRVSRGGVFEVARNKYTISDIGDVEAVDKQYGNILKKKTPVFRESNVEIRRVNNHHRILASLQAFAIEHKRIYPFDGCTLGYDFHFNNGFSIINTPRVFSPTQYRHPFVYATGDICRGKSLASSKLKIYTDKVYGFEDLEKLVLPLAVAASMMRTGYSEKSRPVHSIEQFSPIALAECRKQKRGVYSHG